MKKPKTNVSASVIRFSDDFWDGTSSGAKKMKYELINTDKMKAVEYFWSWFTEYNIKLKNFRSLSPKEQKHYSFWMKWHLHFYAPGLDYIIIFPQEIHENVRLIITAHGDPKYFAKVEEVVDTKPSLKNWDISAFIPPYKDIATLEMEVDKPYKFEDLSIKLSELRCIPTFAREKDRIDLKIFLRDYSCRAKNENITQLILLMIQNLLGEKSFYNDIDLVYLKDIEDDNKNHSIPIYKLKGHINQLDAERNSK